MARMPASMSFGSPSLEVQGSYNQAITVLTIQNIIYLYKGLAKGCTYNRNMVWPTLLKGLISGLLLQLRPAWNKRSTWLATASSLACSA